MQKLDPDFRKALDVAFDRAVSHLEQLDTSVAATLDATELRKRLNKPLADRGIRPHEVVRSKSLSNL